jgi:hypothetical protein
MTGVPADPAPSVEQSPERDALERVLQSDALQRAPNLIAFLRYVCEMQLSGRSEAIKEYNIAVEALGRGPDFDQKRDSIVRVEAHRLRKRLAEHYRTVGADDAVQIVLPAGSYVPVFQTGNDDPPSLPAAEAPVNGPPIEIPGTRAAGPEFRWSAIVGLCVLISALGVLMWKATGASPAAAVGRTSSAINTTVTALPEDRAIRIAVGSERSFADSLGVVWGADRFFSGGDVALATPRAIRRTPDAGLYLARREGEFRYDIPAEPGSYELRLHFAETVFGEDNVAGGGESSRVFRVQVNKGPIWTVDVISEAGGANVANVRIFRDVRPESDGKVHVVFTQARKEAAFVNGIELLPAPDGLVPLRVVARASPLRLDSGHEWASDRYWLGGMLVQRHEPVAGPEPSSLYQGERFGNFSYALPVAEAGRYTLTLRFAETWFGEGRPGGGGAGSRIFDVFCNGRALVRNLDVLREAGGPLRQIKKTFRNLEPNAQGKLNLQFVPLVNYAMVNAIEVVGEAR